jgi:2-polyprenyl-6-methoxyphenol hydroxylase-like FAD-dependent oxidoreductase
MTSGRTLRVAVVGAGIAGLACALGAAQAGAVVDVFDAAPAPVRIAAHLVVVPNLLRDLVGLGLGDACTRTGFPYRSAVVLDGLARPQFEISAERMAGPRYPANIGLTHAGLVDLLHDAATQAAVRWHWHSAVQAHDLRWSGDRVGFADGRIPAPDLMVLATGTDDPLRAALLGQPAECLSLPQAWWYALVARPLALERTTLVMGPQGRKLLLVPTGANTAGLALSGRTAPGQADGVAAGVDVLQRGLAEFSPEVRALLPSPGAALAAGTPVFRRPARALLLPAPWHRGNLVCAGECALTLPPQFAQSAAAAIEHAVVLKDLLAHAGRQPGSALAAAYTDRRWPRARRLHAVTTQAARWDAQPGAETDIAALAQQLAQTVAHPA